MHELDGKKIKDLLPDGYKGLEVIVYDCIDSTNTEAKRLFKKDGNNMLVCAAEQTAGRGRSGKSFFSPEKTGVYFSLVIARKMPLSIAVKATAAAAVAVVEAVEELTGKKPMIKWVNDIFLDGKKVCGILTEAISSDEKNLADGLIVGIGINISTVDFPDEIKEIAGSLGENSVNKNQLIAIICEKLLEFSEDLENPYVVGKYRDSSLVIGREITYERNGEAFTATALDIDENFGLVVRKSDGGKETLTSGEISIKVK